MLFDPRSVAEYGRECREDGGWDYSERRRGFGEDLKEDWSISAFCVLILLVVFEIFRTFP